MLLGLAQVHHAQALERPEQVALCNNATVFPALVQYGQCRIAGMLHPFHRLPQRVVGLYIGAHRLRRQEKENIHASASLYL